MCVVVILDINNVIMFATRHSDNEQRASIANNDETENEGHYVPKT